MTDYIGSEWLCPHCFRHFLGAENLRDHLGFDKSRVQSLLDELSKALNSNGCPATRINYTQPITLEVGEQSCDLPEHPIKEIRRNYELICPDKQCKDKRKPYSKKTNLLRHYRSHINCTAKCACKAILANVDEFIRHFEACPAMQIGKAKDSTLSHEQWEAIKLKDNLLERARQQLDMQMGWHEHGSKHHKYRGHKARKSGVNSLRSSGSHRERENGRTKHNSSALQRPLVSSIPEADTTPTDLFFTGTANRESSMFGEGHAEGARPDTEPLISHSQSFDDNPSTLPFAPQMGSQPCDTNHRISPFDLQNTSAFMLHPNTWPSLDLDAASENRNILAGESYPGYFFNPEVWPIMDS